MPQQISEERRTAYSVGLGLQILGGLLFASAVLTFLAHSGDVTNFHAKMRTNASLAFGGVALLIVGGIIRSVSSRGLAGSGVLLDPERARGDLEPYSRMAGGMVHDALEEVNGNARNAPPPIVKVKCRSCGYLNQEDAKFCQECGAEM